jgi:voltage-gated potassium channel
LSTEETQIQRTDSANATDYTIGRVWTRRWEAAAIDARLRAAMIVATLLVIPDLILEEQPLRTSWHRVAVIGDWFIWLVFLIELVAIMVFARDWQSWLRSYPLAPAMLILTPPFAPAAIQALRVFRLLRLLRVGRGFELLSKLLTLDGLKYAIVLATFLVVGGGAVFASVESHVGHPVSTWDGIWWAIGTVSTEGTNIEATTAAGRAIAIVLMLTGIGVFALLTGAVSQHFITSRPIPRAAELSNGEKAIMARLDELTARLTGIEMAAHSGMSTATAKSRDERAGSSS